MGKKKGVVDIPNWLQGLPLAPEFRPTVTEFADPIAYISNIEKQASAFGICKVIPPLPKPSKKYVFSNLNRCLSREPEPELGSNGVKDRGMDGEVRAVFATRQQELGHNVKKNKGNGNLQRPPAQKQVWQSGEVYTLEQFESKAKAFSRSVLGGLKEVSPLAVEALFWKASIENPIYIEYANDVPGSGFAEPEGLSRYLYSRSRRRKRMSPRKHTASSDYAQHGRNETGKPYGFVLGSSSGSDRECTGVLTSCLGEAETPHFSRQGTDRYSGQMEGTSGWRLSNSPWNLQVISHSSGSLTRFMLDDIPGVTSPMVYIGMLFSWFAWHVEDHELHSLNFLHTGSPKTWYAVPGSNACAFEEVIRTQAYGGEIDHLAALTLLGEKTTLLSPEIVVAAGIPCCRLVQNPGEFVVTFPRAYHIGFSHGFNCGEAANFGTPLWLNIAKEAAVRRAAMDHLPMLSHQQLLYLLTMSFVSRVPRSLLPGVQSSRLKDRQKEERELLVKKAFINDMMNENTFLNVILRLDSNFRAVLWDLNSLPLNKQPPFQSGVAIIASESEKSEQVNDPKINDNQNDLVHQMDSYMEAVNDLYLDDDLSSDFQVDSGALECVACGILGFPFMSVIQPSSKMDMLNMHGAHPLVAGAPQVTQSMKSDPSNIQSNKSGFVSDSVEACDNKWNVSDEFLRPRIFCLEHTVQTEEMLRSYGGAKMLMICHSDYPKIKANAVAVSEEIGGSFDYKEVAIASASEEDLNLISLAINDEEHVRRMEDWTSMLGINLRHCIKARKCCPPKQIKHPFFPGRVPSSATIAPGISHRNWYVKRSRSNRRSRYGNTAQTSETIHVENNGGMKDKLGGCMIKKEEVILQYSRRKHKVESSDCVRPSEFVARTTNNLSKENSADCVDSTGNRKDISRFEAATQAEYTRKVPDSSEPLEQVPLLSSVLTIVVNAKSPSEIQICDEMMVEGDPCTSKASNFHGVLMDVPLAGASEIKKTLDGDASVFSSVSILADNFSMEKDGDLMDHDSLVDTAENPVSMGNCQGSGSGLAVVGEVRTNDFSDINGIAESCETEKLDYIIPDKSGMNITDDCAASSNLELHDIQVVCDTGLEPAYGTVKPDSNCNIPSCSMKGNGCGSLVNTQATSGIKNKRKRDGAVGSYDDNDNSEFVRSPCEGLRSRTKKQLPYQKIGQGDTESAPEKSVNKKVKRASGYSSNPSKKEAKTSEGSYSCDTESCRMRFETRAELSLHKHNRCPYEGCEKRFRSHRYAVIHQRVHEKERPLGCTWKGCTKSFKWAWARTEHLRLHTGERPYECKFDGCGLTFTFVSEYNRHRRKTGHYVNQTTGYK